MRNYFESLEAEIRSALVGRTLSRVVYAAQHQAGRRWQRQGFHLVEAGVGLIPDHGPPVYIARDDQNCFEAGVGELTEAARAIRQDLLLFDAGDTPEWAPWRRSPVASVQISWEGMFLDEASQVLVLFKDLELRSEDGQSLCISIGEELWPDEEPEGRLYFDPAGEIYLTFDPELQARMRRGSFA
ncbi:MAG: hypothetical protein NW241_22405 [Bacteroidia bacterium]|nr:hypothetical protein [Bacteroidia bacterium]